MVIAVTIPHQLENRMDKAKPNKIDKPDAK